MRNVLLRSPSEQRKAAKAADAGRGTNVWSIAGAPERGAMRVYSYMFAGTRPWPQLRLFLKFYYSEFFFVNKIALTLSDCKFHVI